MNAVDDDRIWQAIRSRLDELGNLTQGPALEKLAADRSRWSAPARRTFGLVPAVGVLVVVVAALMTRDGFIAGSSTPTTESQQSLAAPSRIPAVSAAQEGPFELRFQLSGSTYREGEALEGGASLNVNDAVAHRIGASGVGPIAFGFREIGGSRHLDPTFDADCTWYDLAPGKPVTAAILKTGGYDVTDPDASFYADFLTTTGFSLPEGTWDIYALAAYLSPGCEGDPHTITTVIRVVIGP